ncbi:hypothetical protein V8F06_013190 [Rhypophila decipiens]
MLFKGNLLENMISSGKLQLGWLVRDRKRPLSSCHRIPNPPKGERIVEVTNFQDTISEDTKLTLGTFLSQILSLTIAPSSGVSVEVTADVSAIDILPDDEAEDWYNSLCRRTTARCWIQDRISDGDKVRLIVGIHSLQNAKVSVTEHQGNSLGGTITVPLSAILGIPGILDMAVDPGLGALREVERKASRCFEATDIIYAVAYRRIRIGFLSRKNVDATRLGDMQWKYSLKRGPVKKDSGVVNVVDTKLEEDDKDSDEEDEAECGITFSIFGGNELQLN